ncbi:MAG: anhydro-N-acetylmuramic acid kinase [Sedimentisphaerales bacterium]|nr:anhydro-N-acetylmuramic acid kinase [Sedimentisphaerales bacterium]
MTIAKKQSLEKLIKKKMLRVVGLMSGTSADGVDVAVIDISDKSLELIAFNTFAYPAKLRKEIFMLFQPQTARLDNICHYNFVLGDMFAESVIKLCKIKNISLDSIDLIGSHGQTIFHNPKGNRYAKKMVHSTLQIGEPSVIAQRTGITTIADFRPRDIAAGGQGAPLVPYADYFFFRDTKRYRAIQNIGGIANVTYLPANCTISDVFAFDTGPGNMIIDRLVNLISNGKSKYDRGGRIAAHGNINKSILKEMLKHPFLHKRPPKTTGREEFGLQYADLLYNKMKKLSIPNEDMVTTATAFTSESIAKAYRRFLPSMPDEIILCGGGSHNNTLVKMLKNRLCKTIISFSDEFGISSDAKEAVSFAILAYATIKGTVNNVPNATGAYKAVILGKIIPA